MLNPYKTIHFRLRLSLKGVNLNKTEILKQSHDIMIEGISFHVSEDQQMIHLLGRGGKGE